MWILLFIAQVSLALPGFMSDHFVENVSLPVEAKVSYFDNKINHFDLGSKQTYKQRYWYVDDYWDKDSGPAILFVQGEAPGDHYVQRPVPLYLARSLKGIWFALEHRFYGISQPQKDWSVESLKLLTHDQAMADIAHFIVTKTREMGNVKRKWLLVGGSYAGALVIWFKARYPHLADVVYSSSGVVNVIEDYNAYMKQIFEDVSEDQLCYKVIFDIVNHAAATIRRGVPEQIYELKAAMSAKEISNDDFLNYVSELYLGEIQYSNRTGICNALKRLNEERNILKRMTLYAEIGKSLGVLPDEYQLIRQKNITINPRDSSRQWMYQVCTAYGWFATGTSTNPIRPKELDVAYFKGICKRIFGADLYPDVSYTNGMLGELKIPPMLKHIVMVNGRDDPWKWASYLRMDISDKDKYIKIINCDDCAHCIDLYDTKPTDPFELRDARQNIQRIIIGWMNEKTTGLPKINY